MDRKDFDPNTDPNVVFPSVFSRRWMPVVLWRRPTVSDTYDASAPFERRIIASPLAVLGVIIACAVIGLLFYVFK